MEDIFECSICYNGYNYDDRLPRQLDCQHSLCSQCLPHMQKNDNKIKTYIECPMCKEKTNKRLEDIPRSLLMIQLMDATKYTAKVSNTQLKKDGFSSQPLTQTYNHQQSLTISEYTKDSTSQTWDTKKFLRSIFNEMDLNKDGSIASFELQEVLRRGQGSDFSLKTIDHLISKYDKNGDREISFEEFYDLYINLNEEYENFLLTDSDGSGFIDSEEFSITMLKKGYQLSNKFYKFIVDEISKHTGTNGIKFDNYMRVAARIVYLVEYYNKTPFFHKYTLETYLKNTFFQDFW